MMDTYNNWLCALAVALVVLVTVDAGCKEAKLCCSGTKNTCKTQGFRQYREGASKNATDIKLLKKLKILSECYCDEHCSAQGDCCDDYEEACPAKDCELGEWEKWSECSERCGVGMRRRTRPVITEPQHGGKPCDSKLQKGRCESNEKCKVARHSNAAEKKETGKLVPATFGTWRKNKRYNPLKDIRKNLFRHYSSNKFIQRPSYCAKFELTKVGRACHSKAAKAWVKVLKEGSTLCVECQQFAMKKNLGFRCHGHGVYLTQTAWNAVASPGCHGAWVMQSLHEECSCDVESDHSFILI